MAGCSGLPPFCSEMGVVGKISSLGSTMLTWSGRGFLGPIFPLGSQGNIIFTLIPSTPVKSGRTTQSINHPFSRDKPHKTCFLHQKHPLTTLRCKLINTNHRMAWDGKDLKIIWSQPPALPLDQVAPSPVQTSLEYAKT